jgi:hypothetical protein
MRGVTNRAAAAATLVAGLACGAANAAEPHARLAAAVERRDGAVAHHAIGAVYDASQPVTLEGMITAFHYINPHPFVEMQVEATDGMAESWRLEFDNLRELADAGMSVETFKVGDRITVIGSRARDKSRSAYVRRLERRADGFLYEQVGSSPRVRSRRR